MQAIYLSLSPTLLREMQFPDVPFDMLLLILRRLSVPEVLRLRQTCKRLYHATMSHAVWYHLLHSEVYANNVPFQNSDEHFIKSLPAEQLERVIVSAVARRRRWTSPKPKPLSKYSIPFVSSRVISLHFYRHYLFSDSLLSAGNRVIDCWDISKGHPQRVATRSIPPQSSVSFNKESNGSAVLAVALPNQIELLGINISSAKLVIHGRIPAQDYLLRLFSGTVFVFEHGQRLLLGDVNHPQEFIGLQSGSNQDDYLDAIIENGFVIVLRSASIGIYEIPASFNSVSYLPPIVEAPFSIIHSGRMVSLKSSTGRRKAINILVRYQAANWHHPISANMLHHYTLFPNRSYDHSQPSSSINLPFDFPPLLTETIGSPLRSIRRSDLPFAIGPYGTGIWIDNHVEDYFGPTFTGQRVASSILIDARDDGELSDNVMNAAMATTVYDYQKDDTWTCVAMDEIEGRLAVGGTQGITVSEY